MAPNDFFDETTGGMWCLSGMEGSAGGARDGTAWMVQVSGSGFQGARTRGEDA